MKKIEDIEVGDLVKSWNQTLNKIVTGQVEQLISPKSKQLVNLNFGAKKTSNTLDHPFYVKGKGWSSVNPTLTKERYTAFKNLSISRLMVGDMCYKLEQGRLQEVKLLSIELEEVDQLQTYNFRVGEYHSYFANKILVHNK